MEKPKATSEKIRSILTAMERSIDSARRKRLNQPGETIPADQAHDEASTIPADRDGESENHLRNDHPDSATGESTTAPECGRSDEKRHHDDSSHESSGSDAPPPRLKARPKRPSAFFTPPGPQSWQSRAG
jgi:hypothetical protein